MILQKLCQELDIDFEEFLAKYTKPHKYRNINLPTGLDKSLAQFLGYYLGDGTYEIDRILFFEQRKEVAQYYQILIKEIFGVDSDLRFRKSKNYWSR